MTFGQWHTAGRAADLRLCQDPKERYRPIVTTPIVVGDLADLTPSLLRHLRARNRSPETLKPTARQPASWSSSSLSGGCHGGEDPSGHIEAFIEHLLAPGGFHRRHPQSGLTSELRYH